MEEHFELKETRLKRALFGVIENEKQEEAIRKLRPDMDIVMTKWAGLEATCVLADRKGEELGKRFSKTYIERSKRLLGYISTESEMELLAKCGVDSYVPVGVGGLFSALYEMMKLADLGLEVNLLDIPIKQETIEFAECFGLNPYMILGTGSVIAVCDNGARLVRHFEEQKIPARVIGSTTREKGRRIIIPIADDDISASGETRRRHKREERQLTPARSDAVAELAGLS